MPKTKLKGEIKMSEKEKAREIVYHAPVVDFDNKVQLTTAIGYGRKPDEKYEIVWDVPETDEACKERYDCDLKTLIEAGVRQFSTRPNYQDVGFDDNGVLKPDGHLEMQKLADGYKVGQRQVGVGQKATVAKVKKAEAELDMSLDDMVKKIAELKAEGKLD